MTPLYFTAALLIFTTKNVTVAEQLWESMHNIIKFSSDMMRPFLAAVGVKTEDMLPFCRKFTSLRDLRDTFIRY